MNGTTELTITLGDGFVMVEPIVPASLSKALRYWRRSLAYDHERHQRVATGQYEELYTIESWMDTATGTYKQRMVTLPGFAHRIRETVRGEGFTCRFVDTRTPMPKPDIERACIGLREYQVEGVYTALASGGGILSAPTGWGKSYALKAIASAYKHEDLLARNTPITVIAAPDKDITAKNYRDLKELMPDRDVGLVMSGFNKFSDDIQIITLDSLHRLDPLEVGIVIVDEVHTAASDKRTDLVLKMSKAARWGVSATPTGRFDGRDLVAEGMFGPVVYKSTYADGVKAGALVPIEVIWLECPLPNVQLDRYLDYKTRQGRYRHGVWRNNARNALIADLFARLNTADHQVLAIMQYLDHMNSLLSVCGQDIVQVHAETDKQKLVELGYTFVNAVSTEERRAIYRKMELGEIRKAVSTYVYKQGVNFPGLDVVIQAGGGGSDIVAKQIPGRESRKVAGKSVSYLIDFWHPWDTAKNKKGRVIPGPVHSDDKSREKAYTQLGFNQVWIKDLSHLPFLKTATA